MRQLRTSERKSRFSFKTFELQQRQSAWPVGTDSVLLGAWTQIDQRYNILDLGCGTGVLALMLASRNPECRIDAIDIDEYSVQEARINVARSPWSDRITVLKGDVRDWARQHESSYDLIICNPPYFEGKGGENAVRNLARFGSTFSAKQLPQVALNLLAPGGIISVVLPIEITPGFIEEANNAQLYVCRRINVARSSAHKVSLVLIELSRRLANPVIEQLLMFENESATPEYRNLVGKYYKFDTF